MAKKKEEIKENEDEVYTLFGFVEMKEDEECCKIDKFSWFDFIKVMTKQIPFTETIQIAVNTSQYSQMLINRSFCTKHHYELVNELNLFHAGLSNEMHMDILSSIHKPVSFLKYHFKKPGENEELDHIKFHYNLVDDKLAERYKRLLDNHPEFVAKLKEKYSEYQKMTKSKGR